MNKLFSLLKHNLLTVGMTAVVVGLSLVLAGMAQQRNKDISLTSVKSAPQPHAVQKTVAKVEGAATTEPIPTPTATPTAPASSQPSVPKTPVAPKPAATAPKPKPTAPVAPVAPAIWSTPATRPGQFAPGTQIGANKSTRTFYGGDLVLSLTSITFTHGVSDIVPITVTIPDGVVSGIPRQAWNNTLLGLNLVNGAPDTGTSFTEQITFSGNTPPGTYTMHLHTIRYLQGLDTWDYDGWITIVVQ